MTPTPRRTAATERHLADRRPWRRTACWHVYAVAVGTLLLFGLATPVFAGEDERPHLGYAVSLRDGSLPTILTPVPEADAARDLDVPPRPHRLIDGTDVIWVANHPPLAHALSAPFASRAGIGALRAVNLAMASLGLLFVLAIARELHPDPRVACLTLGLVALCPQFVGKMSLGYTDGTSFAAAAALLWVALRVLSRRPSPGLLATLVTASALGAATRAALIPLAVVALCCWLYASRRNVAVALAGAVLVAAAATLTAGWFYLRNLQLYGDPTGAAAVQDLFSREPQGSLLSVLADPRWVLGIWQQLWGGARPGVGLGTGHGTVGEPVFSFGSNFVVGVSLVGLAVLGWRTSRAGTERASPVVPRAAKLVMAAWVTAVLVPIADFAAGGGTPHPRYAFTALPVAALLLAMGLAGLGRRVSGAVLAGLVVVNAVLFGRITDPPHRAPAWSVDRTSLLVAAAGALLAGWWALRDREVRAVRVPAAAH